MKRDEAGIDSRREWIETGDGLRCSPFELGTVKRAPKLNTARDRRQTRRPANSDASSPIVSSTPYRIVLRSYAVVTQSHYSTKSIADTFPVACHVIRVPPMHDPNRIHSPQCLPLLRASTQNAQPGDAL